MKTVCLITYFGSNSTNAVDICLTVPIAVKQVIKSLKQGSFPDNWTIKTLPKANQFWLNGELIASIVEIEVIGS